MTIRTLGKPAAIMGNCTTCGDTPNVGKSDPLVAGGLALLRMSDLPVFEMTGCPNPFAPEGAPSEPIYTSDPGKGLLTGVCSDANRIKGPSLRGVARAPCFYNGAAQNLTSW